MVHLRGGQADTVNAGVRLAKGEILGWVNSDNTHQPGAVTVAVEPLMQADLER